MWAILLHTRRSKGVMTEYLVDILFGSEIPKTPSLSVPTIKPSQNPRPSSHFARVLYLSMATHSISRSILCRPAKSLSLLFTRSFASSAPLAKAPATSLYTSSLLTRSRPLVAAFRGGLVSVKGLSSQATSSSLNDPSPNWSNRPPKETILLDGCDFEHWLVVVDPPEGDPTRDEIIDSYIKTLAQIVGR